MESESHVEKWNQSIIQSLLEKPIRKKQTARKRTKPRNCSVCGNQCQGSTIFNQLDLDVEELEVDYRTEDLTCDSLGFYYDDRTFFVVSGARQCFLCLEFPSNVKKHMKEHDVTFIRYKELITSEKVLCKICNCFYSPKSNHVKFHKEFVRVVQDGEFTVIESGISSPDLGLIVQSDSSSSYTMLGCVSGSDGAVDTASSASSIGSIGSIDTVESPDLKARSSVALQPKDTPQDTKTPASPDTTLDVSWIEEMDQQPETNENLDSFRIEKGYFCKPCLSIYSTCLELKNHLVEDHSVIVDFL